MAKCFLAVHQAALASQEMHPFHIPPSRPGICQGNLSAVCSWLSHGLHPFPPLLLWLTVLMSFEAVEAGGGLVRPLLTPDMLGLLAPRHKFECLSRGLTKSLVMFPMSSLGYCPWPQLLAPV